MGSTPKRQHEAELDRQKQAGIAESKRRQERVADNNAIIPYAEQIAQTTEHLPRYRQVEQTAHTDES